MIKFDDEEFELDNILIEAAVHIKLSLEMKNVLQIFYPLYKTTFKNEKYLLIPLELGVCTLNDYLDFLKKYKKPLNYRDIYFIIMQILVTIFKFHINGAAHRDVKPDNVILSRNEKYFKISDMGLSCFFKKANDRYYIAGTPKYLSKKILKSYEEIT